jgi:hypothetical protein
MAVLTEYVRAFMVACGFVAAVAMCGCRNLDNAQVDVLERELRQQEDYIYELEDYLIEYSEKLRAARTAQCPPGQAVPKSGTTAPRTPLREPTLDDDPIVRPTLPLNGRSKLTSPPAAPTDASASEAPLAEAVAAPTDAPPAEPTVAPPAEPTVAPPAEPASPPAEEVDPETLEAPELQIGPVGDKSADGGTLPVAATPLLIPDPVDYQTDVETPPTESALVAASEASPVPQLAAPQNAAPRLSAKELKIRKIFTQPAADEGSLGSLLVVVEAVNATDEPVDAIGAASIMVMARDEAGVPRKIERWDFNAEETAAAWQSSHLGDGLHLELPLTNPELPAGELELWARVVGEDGAKLLTASDNPCRFEAAKLAALDDAATEASLASAEPAEPLPLEPIAVETAGGKPDAKAAVAKAPETQWRASTVRHDSDRAEGFATTASNRSASWTTTPINGDAPRVATAPAKTKSPTWKRSTRAAAAESTPAWSAER